VTTAPSSAPVDDDEEQLLSYAPQSYTLRFNLTQTCDDATVAVGPDTGVADYLCRTFLESNGADVTNNDDEADDVIVEVTAIQILDLDSNFQAMGGSGVLEQNQVFVDGDVFTYISAAASSSSSLLLGGMIARFRGVTSEGVAVIHEFIVRYSNTNCLYPVFVNGDNLGWVTFDNVGPPQNPLCT
jgi:hypothetical protein